MFRQYQTVELVKDMMSDGFIDDPVQMHEGQRGVIVEIHRQPGLPIGYDVEFFDEEGETLALMIMTEDMIRPSNKPLISSKRSKT
jgi:hypothetical protein